MRDEDADRSTEAHSIEYWFFRGWAVLKVTGRITGVTVGATTPIARDVTKRVPAGDRKAICFPHLKGRAPNVDRRDRFRSKLIAMCGTERGATNLKGWARASPMSNLHSSAMTLS